MAVERDFKIISKEESTKCKNEADRLVLCDMLTDIIINNLNQEFGLKKVSGNGKLHSIVYRKTDTCLIPVYFCPFCGEDLRLKEV